MGKSKPSTLSRDDRSIPYDERSDDQKLTSNWKKATGLYERGDWSASIVRVATATEIAANIYVRHYLQEQHGLPDKFVDALLMTANGMNGKFRQLITPASKCLETWSEIRTIQTKVETINRHRNEIAHSGKFKNKPDADLVFKKAVEVINLLSPNVASNLSIPNKNA